MKNFPFRVLSALAALILIPTASATTISEGDFVGWSLTGYTHNGGLFEGDLLSTGGNPGANIAVFTDTHLEAQDYAGIAVYNPNSTTHSVLSGNFTLTIDAAAGANSQGQGQGIFVVVAQGSNVYIKGLNATYVPQGWQNYSFNGDFNDPSSFLLVVGDGPAAPDFSGATASSLGFAAGNSGSASLTQFYDNFTLTYTDTNPVPEPTSLTLLGTGATAIIGTLRRRRA